MDRMNCKSKRLLTVLILGLGPTLAVLGLMIAFGLGIGIPKVAWAAVGDVYCVTPVGGTYPGCDQVFTDAQAAVDAATGGEEIWVAAGTYTGLNTYSGLAQVVYISKTVTIRGGYSSDFSSWDPDSNTTTLDAQGQGRVLYVEGIISPTIESLHLANGSALGLGGTPWGSDAGGGVYILWAEATFENCHIANNTASNGGGMYLRYSNSKLNGNVFTANNAQHGGGASLDNSAATLNSNTIVDNIAEDGGGLVLDGSAATLSDNVIADNAAHTAGGLYLITSTATLNNNAIIGNTASEGGGLAMYDSPPTLNGNLIRANIAYTGGGLLLVSSSDALLTNNIIADNEPDGLVIQGSSPQLLHNTLAYNVAEFGGSGLYVTDYYASYSTVALTNTILFGHSYGILVNTGNSAYLESTLWGNTTDWMGPGTIFTGTNNYWGSPDFVDVTGGAYHLGPNSIAINQGISTTLSYDIDGEARPQGALPDLGADEVPDLSIMKSAPLIVEPGSIITYTLTVINNSAIPLTNLVITDSIPAGANYLSGGSRIGDTVSWTVSSLAASTATQVTYFVTSSVNLVNDDYRISANGGYSATGKVMAPTLVNNRQCWVRLNDDPTEYTTIQAAVDASTSSSDIVKVAGHCSTLNTSGGPRQVVSLSKTLTIRGGYTTTNWTTPDPVANPTTIDARRRGRGIYIIGSGNSPTIEGLRIINGTASGLGGYQPNSTEYDAGGGVYVDWATATFNDNLISHNYGSYGGGVFLSQDTPTLNGNQVTDNYGSYGGGLFLYRSRATLTENSISRNRAFDGGGVYVEDPANPTPTLKDNTIADNIALNYGGGVHLEFTAPIIEGNTISDNRADRGGGVYADTGGTSGARINQNLITTNSAHRGGGVYTDSGAPTLNRNRITGNTAEEEGGGIHVNSQGNFLNNLIADNHTDGNGSGVYFSGSGEFKCNTVARNSGSSGIYVGYSVTPNFVNTIIVSHTTGLQVGFSNSTAILDATLWYGNDIDWSGSVSRTNDYFDPPSFVAPDAGDYHLSATSMAIDRGIATSVTDDIDGDLRPQGLAPDLGADERLAPTLTIVKSGPATALPGDPITYTLAITNTGGVTATNLIVTDVIPFGASYVSGGTRVGNVVNWNIPDLAPSISTSVQFVVTATQTLINSDYTVSADDGYSASGSVAVVTLFPQSCEAYPIALHTTSIAGLQPGDSTGSIYWGTGPGQFGWLLWDPSQTSEAYLVEELRNPGLSLNDFTDATDPGDHSLSVGDWVRVFAVAGGSNDLRDELDRLITTGATMRIVVWDNAAGSGSTLRYHVQRFILAKITDYNLVQDWINLTYVAEAEDPESCRDFALTLVADDAQTGLPGQDMLYTHTLTNQGHYTETVVLTYTTTPADWLVNLSPISPTLGPGQAVTVTSIVTIPLGSLEGVTNVTYITATIEANSTISATVVDTTTVTVNGPALYLPIILKDS